jgi:hypothetical protein
MHALNFSRYGVLTECWQSPHELLSPCSICWQFRWHLISERSWRLEKPLVVRRLKFGSRGRIRTYDQSVNSRPLYH